MYSGTVKTGVVAKVWSTIGGRQIEDLKPGVRVTGIKVGSVYFQLYTPVTGYTKQIWLDVTEVGTNPPAPVGPGQMFPRLWRPNLPEVFRLDPDAHVVLTEPMQRLWRAMNPQLTNDQWRRCLGNDLAFTNNGTGFPGHADYINGVELDKSDPRFDQMRVCGGAFLAGSPFGRALLIDAIDVRKPLPTAHYVMARPWLYFEAVNADWSVEKQGIVIRRFKGEWNQPVYVPVLISVDATFPLELLTEVLLPSPYTYP